MTRITWDQVGQRFYETGVSNGVLYLPVAGVYSSGYAWNGLTSVTESPSGAESNPVYADNIKYLDLRSAEEFGATIEALTYPMQFEECDGTRRPTTGVAIGRQGRRVFGFSYKTLLGNDELGNDYGFKYNMVYGAQAAPSEKARTTVNDSPEPTPFSWELTTSPVAVTGFKPTAILTVNSTDLTTAKKNALEDMLYGTVSTDPRLPLPDEVIALMAGSVTLVIPADPTFVSGTGVITIPTTTGVQYRVDGVVKTGTHTVPASSAAVVKAVATGNYALGPQPVQDTWVFRRP